MTTKHAPKTTAHAIADVAPSTLVSRAAQITKHLDAIDELMSDGVELSDAERKVALRLQGDDEVAALRGVLAFATARPELFKDLADEDNGDDPTTFETTLLQGRPRQRQAQLMADLVARLDETRGTTLSDSALYVTTLAKRPTLAAYEIAKPFQTRDRENGKMLNAAVNLYRAHTLAGAKTKAAKQRRPRRRRSSQVAQAAGNHAGLRPFWSQPLPFGRSPASL